MCGRYRLTAKERWLSAHFNIDPEDVEWAARWNVAPTQEVATVLEVRREPNRTFRKMRWGLIPYWAKDASFGGSTINAVSETAIEKPAFREPLRRRRCLIPADGFYEWRKTGSNKQAYHIGMVDDGLFSFAGLWDSWSADDNRPSKPAPGSSPSHLANTNKAGALVPEAQDGKVIVSCTILTTEANALLKSIHSRMPVILHPDDYDRWLDPDVVDPSRVADLLRPFDAWRMRAYPVSATVNRVENDGPDCAKEASPEPLDQASLF
jgi:putative SOS response-associated peptidase YedK